MGGYFIEKIRQEATTGEKKNSEKFKEFWRISVKVRGLIVMF